MRDFLNALLLIALLIAGGCGFLYLTGNGQVVSDAASSLGFLFQDTAGCDESSYYASLACQDAQNAGIPPDLFVRQIQQESGFQPDERSPAGAEGIAQFMPATASGLGIDPWDPDQALAGAAQLMANYYQNYGDYAKALAAYNGGSGTLAAAMRNCGSQWLSCEPAQTQAYVHNIMGQ
jgi:soluble lytic murein transglycosylase-like protein